jgi:hypothetical protein
LLLQRLCIVNTLGVTASRWESIGLLGRLCGC